MGDELTSLVADMQAAARQGVHPPPAFMSQLFASVLPPWDGSFQEEVLGLLEALHELQATPPYEWAFVLDAALLGYCMDPEAGLLLSPKDMSAPSPSWPLSLQQCHAALALLSRAQAHQLAQPGIHPTPLMFPLLLDAVLMAQAPAAPPSASTAAESPGGHTQEALASGVDAFYALLDPAGSSSSSSRRRGLWALYIHSGSLPWQLQGPLLRRYGPRLAATHLSAVVNRTIVAIDEQCGAGGNAFAEAQAQLLYALQLWRGLAQAQLAALLAPDPPTATTTTSPPPSSMRSTSSGSGSVQPEVDGLVMLDVCGTVLDLAAHLHYQAGPLATLDGGVTQAAVSAIRAAMELAEVQGEHGFCAQWLASMWPSLDAMCCTQDHPATLIDGLVVLARDPRPSARTPGQAVTVLHGHLSWFTDEQLTDALQALGRFIAAGAGEGQHPGGAAASPGGGVGGPGVVPLESLVPGGKADSTRSLLRQHAAMPDDLADYIDAQHPPQGPAYDSDPSLDLLARIGLRLSSRMLAASGGERQAMLSRLGIEPQSPGAQ